MPWNFQKRFLKQAVVILFDWLKSCSCNVVSCDVNYNIIINYNGAQIASIFEGQPLKTRPFPSKTRVIWVLGAIYDKRIFSNRFRSTSSHPSSTCSRPKTVFSLYVCTSHAATFAQLQCSHSLKICVKSLIMFPFCLQIPKKYTASCSERISQNFCLSFFEGKTNKQHMWHIHHTTQWAVSVGIIGQKKESKQMSLSTLGNPKNSIK